MWNKFLVNQFGKEVNLNLSQLEGKSNLSPLIRGISSIKKFNGAEALLDVNKFKWEIGDGKLVYFWEDWWWSEGQLAHIFPRLYEITSAKFTSIFEFLLVWRNEERDSVLWIGELLPADAAQIMRVNEIVCSIKLQHCPDKLMWMNDRGPLASKAFLRYLTHSEQTPAWVTKEWHNLWRLKAPPKIKIFMCKVKWGVLPTNKFLHIRMPAVDPLCRWCLLEEESQNHMLWECVVARWIWAFIKNWWSLEKEFSRI